MSEENLSYDVSSSPFWEFSFSIDLSPPDGGVIITIVLYDDIWERRV